ncbi:N-acetylmuramoyl-L-alanine amidase [Sporosarcina newyorkensis 2681]|uniref:N-acetylmuramoyl-L-alanine amidase n=1 Tax=Sporosarcina newyorkensis 2681 TaxID=1027292 RepID=F9DR09_9BACL|nr:N-acetylmuramoyl-L-alanine amidase [Sporosarcina newyorkensis]EGQ26759.1 N-acetylmuramoyl-L-alanine amidase [Sporosarcina newyorkensis 2681]
MTRLLFDYGHGGTDPGAMYKGRKEADDVLSIGKAVAAEVRRHGVALDETRTSNKTVSLRERSNMENRKKYDYFISFHRNAFQPEKAKGAETFLFTTGGALAKQLAERIQKELVAVGFTNRGVKRANFHVLRETKAPAILIEIGFIDNTADNQLFDKKRKQIVEGIARAILAQVGVTYKAAASKPTSSSTGTLYRVMAGSFADKANAEKQVTRLKKAGFEAVIMPK